MSNTNQRSMDILNNLLEINNDRMEGYSHASEETNEVDLKCLFTQFAKTSYKCQQELTSEVRKLGSTPVRGTHVLRKLYRTWMNIDIKAALANKDRKAILNSSEFKEDIAVKNYEDALKDNPFGSNLYSLILYSLIFNQYTMIRADHNQIKNLREILMSMEV